MFDLTIAFWYFLYSNIREIFSYLAKRLIRWDKYIKYIYIFVLSENNFINYLKMGNINNCISQFQRDNFFSNLNIGYTN